MYVMIKRKFFFKCFNNSFDSLKEFLKLDIYFKATYTTRSRHGLKKLNRRLVARQSTIESSRAIQKSAQNVYLISSTALKQKTY